MNPVRNPIYESEPELVARIERLQIALRQIRALDHDIFDTTFRYEQMVRSIAHRALAEAEDE